jgi:hypothetical protein
VLARLPRPVRDVAQPYAPAGTPDVLVRLCGDLGKGPETIKGGPCFVFPPRLGNTPASPLPVIVSDAPGSAAARRLDRPDTRSGSSTAGLERPFLLSLPRAGRGPFGSAGISGAVRSHIASVISDR